MAATCPIDFDVGLLRERVRTVYTEVAADPSGAFHFHRGPRYDASVDVVISNGVLGGALPEPELLTLVAEAGLVGGTIHARFSSFSGASAEARVSADLRLSAVNFSARRAD